MKLRPTLQENEYLLEHIGIGSDVATTYLEHQLPGGISEALETRYNKDYKTEIYEALGHIAQQGNGDLFLLADVVEQVRNDRLDAERRVHEAMGFSVWVLPETQEEKDARGGQMRIVSDRILRGHGWRVIAQSGRVRR